VLLTGPLIVRVPEPFHRLRLGGGITLVLPFIVVPAFVVQAPRYDINSEIVVILDVLLVIARRQVMTLQRARTLHAVSSFQDKLSILMSELAFPESSRL